VAYDSLGASLLLIFYSDHSLNRRKKR
jgi:hypothetical protein